MCKTDKAILVVSFGTMSQDTCNKTIGAIEQALADAFTERAIYRAWTSTFIIKKMQSTLGIHIDTLEEAFERMHEDGITDVIVQPTHLLDGFENERMKQVIADKAVGRFDKIAIGSHLLAGPEDIDTVAGIIIRDIYHAQKLDDTSALVMMGHGNRHDASSNDVYSDLQNRLYDKGYHNILVGTVEGTPTLEDVLAVLDHKQTIKNIWITPLMIVAGNHALQDMAGEDEASWKNVFAATGRNAVPVIKGLGEYTGIRNMFIEHARNAKTI